MWRNKVFIDTLLGTLNRELSSLEDRADIVLNYTPDELTTEEAIVALMELASSVKDTCSYWRNYCNSYEVADGKDKELVNKIAEDNKQLRSCLLELISKYNKLATLTNKTVSEFNSNVADAVGSIALKNFLRSEEYKGKDRRGTNSPRYRQDVSDEELKELYEAGSSVAELADKFKLTPNGVRIRLKALGIFKDKRFKDNNGN